MDDDTYLGQRRCFARDIYDGWERPDGRVAVRMIHPPRIERVISRWQWDRWTPQEPPKANLGSDWSACMAGFNLAAFLSSAAEGYTVSAGFFAAGGVLFALSWWAKKRTVEGKG